MNAEIAEAKKSKAALNELIKSNAPLIHSIVKRYIGCGTEAEDLFQLGSIGFIKAVRDYDESFGTVFSTYAVPKIAGEIRRFLRDDGMVKVSRGVKEKSKKINAAEAAFEKEFGRAAKLSELSGLTGLEPEEIAMCAGASAQTFSLDAELDEDGFSLYDVVESRSSEDGIVEKMDMADALGSLPDHLKRVISLRWFHGLTQQKTAEILNVSQVQVSRYEKKAFSLMRKKLSEIT